MKNRIKATRMVFIYLFLHSAIIVMLFLLLAGGGTLSANPLLTTAVIFGGAAVTLYTAHIVVRSITDEIERREKELSKTSASLQTTLAMLGKYAKELDRRTAIMSECGKELEQRAHILNDYSDKINALMAMAEVSDQGNEVSVR